MTSPRVPRMPTYLDQDTYRMVKETAFAGQLEDGLAQLRWPSLLDDAVSGLRSVYERGMAQAAPTRPSSPEMPIIQTQQQDPMTVLDTLQRQQARDAPLPEPVAPARPAAAPGAQTTLAPPTFSAADFPSFGAPGASTAATGAPGAAMGLPGAAPAGEIDNSSRQAFVRTAWPHMLAAAGGNHDAAEMMLAAAISENGSIGTGRPFWANNFFGIKGQGDAGSVNAATHEIVAGGRQDITDAFAAYSSPTAGFRAFFDFLQTNPRYAGALGRYQQTGDAAQLFRDANAAGYATDPQWASKVENIRANQVAPVTRALGRPTAGEPGGPPLAAGPVWGEYDVGTLVPNQFTEGQAQGLSTAQALAICGPAAAVAFSRANGRNPTLKEATELAQNLGLWDESVGMHGPASQVQLLQQMGVPSRLEQGTDWGRVAAEVQQGRPVIVDTPKHYYTVTAYDPQSGTFEFGQSAGVLKASGGRTRFRPDEIPGLGMGAPRATIFMGGGSR